MILYDINDIISLNKLWSKIFPYLSLYIKELYGRDEGSILEFGIFSGGISIELAKISKKFDIIIGGLDSEELAEYIRDWVKDLNLSENIKVEGSLSSFENGRFDLVISRGFFFYLDNEDILKDILRILKPDGIAILGGGYGGRTPKLLIDEIVQESKILNEKLGRRWFSKDVVKEILQRNNLIDKSSIIDEGGLWIRICKNV